MAELRGIEFMGMEYYHLHYAVPCLKGVPRTSHRHTSLYHFPFQKQPLSLTVSMVLPLSLSLSLSLCLSLSLAPNLLPFLLALPEPSLLC